VDLDDTVITARADAKRLTLQIERDVVARARLRLLLAAADSTIAGHLQDLRAVQAGHARRAMTNRKKRSPHRR
jgi:hypothetical protein